ncbi:MAG: hypothetical protein DID89_2727546478 [Candidatus Nitrotoga sp. CP45]|nr:MAG: hypothetical protein DID89_2727546478 [Candidatus Nitrotoga sp. CP45]
MLTAYFRGVEGPDFTPDQIVRCRSRQVEYLAGLKGVSMVNSYSMSERMTTNLVL